MSTPLHHVPLSFDSRDLPRATRRAQPPDTTERITRVLGKLYFWIRPATCKIVTILAPLIGAIGLFLLLPLKYAENSANAPDLSTTYTSGVFFLVIFILLIVVRFAFSEWLYVIVRKRLPSRLPNRHQVINESHGYRRARSLIAYAQKEFSEAEIATAVIRLLYPERATSRIAHTFKVGTGLWPHEITRTINPAVHRSTSDFVAIHRPAKAEVADQFAVEVDGSATAAISARDGFALTGMTLTSVYMWLRSMSEKDLSQDVLWCSILTAVLSDNPTDNDAVGVHLPETIFNVDTPTLSDYVDALKVLLASVDADKASTRDRFLGALTSLFRDQIIWARIEWEKSPPQGQPQTGDTAPAERPRTRLLSALRANRLVHRLPQRSPAPSARASRPKPKRVVVRYTTRHAMKSAGRGERHRIRFGLVPKRIYMTLPWASETISYHLEMEVPPGMYVYTGDARLRVVPSGGGTPAGGSGSSTLTAQGSRLPVVRSSPLGTNTAHIYVRDIARLAAKSGQVLGDSVTAVASFEFRERPPGMLLPVALLSGYLCALVWVVGGLQPDIFARGGPVGVAGRSIEVVNGPSIFGQFAAQLTGQISSSSSGWATILFGMPAILSAWIVSKFSGEHIAKMSLASLSAVAWCIGNASMMVFLALSLSVRYSPFPISLWDEGWWVLNNLSHITVADILWPILMISCAANVTLIALMLVARLGRYSIRRRGAIDNMHVGVYTKEEEGS